MLSVLLPLPLATPFVSCHNVLWPRDSHSLCSAISLSRSLSSPLCQSVTLPPRVDWIHLTGYTAYDITALWCMAERVVALRHHNLTSATGRNGTRAWHCSPGLVFALDWPLVVIFPVTSSRDLFAPINGSAALNLRIGPRCHRRDVYDRCLAALTWSSRPRTENWRI